MSLTFKVIMFSTSHIDQYARLSAEINRRYCQQHGYAFAFEQYDGVALAPQHEKVRLLYKHLGSATYIVWIDSDACVIDYRQQLAEFCGGDRDFIIAGYEKGFDLAGNHVSYRLGNTPCGLNTGIMMLRSSPWSWEFLESWWNLCLRPQARHQRFHEQGQLQQMLMTNQLDLQSHTHLVVPSSRINRDTEHGEDLCEFILHLWASDNGFRQQTFQSILDGRRPHLNVKLPKFCVPRQIEAAEERITETFKSIFLDCGTHRGEGLTQFMQMGIVDDSFEVHTFEPNPACQLDALDDLPLKITIHRAAVWIEDGEVSFLQENYQAVTAECSGASTYLDGVGSSVAKVGMQHPGYERPVHVPSVDFSRFIASLPLGARIICKLDIEGSEFPVLRHLLTEGTMSRIAELYCEFHERFLPDESELSKAQLIAAIEAVGTQVHPWY